jgi:hypothetical protein
MKFIKFLLAAMSLFALTACMGGGSVKDSVNDDTRIITSTVVGSDGKLSYSGTGDMAGFSISATATDLAGRTVYIEKSEAEYSVDGYVSLSPVYTITVAGKADVVFIAKITVPYSSAILANEGGVAADSFFCSLSGGSVTEYTTTRGSGNDVTATASFPGSFFAGIKKDVPTSTITGIIKLSAVSYKAATAFLTDGLANPIPDTARGTDHVQPGEKVYMDIDAVTFGEDVTSYSWALSAKPAGSASSLTLGGSAASFVPDATGTYTVTLTLNGANGKTETESKNIFALNYTADTGSGNASCVSCHDGSLVNSGLVDKYGRQILRAMYIPWSSSAHGVAFAAISGQTDSKCYQCHAAGFRPDSYTSAAGYDDKVTNWVTMATSGATHLQGVTCEACHGPNGGSTTGFFASHYKNTPTTSNTCLTCHDYSNVSGHGFKYSDTHDNSHTLAGGTVAKNTACFKCHTGEGMMGRIFDKDINPSNTETVSGIGCSVCHDPHGESGLAAQLRINGSYTLPTGNTVVNAGNSKLCYSCHNADSELPSVGAIPHNTQAEMLNGIGGYTYGTSLGTTKSIHSFSGAQCSTCHMKTQSGATHELDMQDDPTARIEGCKTGCHTSSTPVYTNGHFDLNGGVATAMTKIEALKAAINAKAGEPAGTAIRASYSTSATALSTALNRAAYNYNYIMNDRSSGFHNPSYVTKLVDLSLADLAAN